MLVSVKSGFVYRIFVIDKYLFTLKTTIMAVTFDLAIIARDGLATTNTLGLATNRVINVRPANASEISQFPTAATAVNFNVIEGNSSRVATYLSATAIATVKTAINA